VLDWSYEQLEPAVRCVFERLAVFAGRFDLDAARAVAAGDGVDPDDVTPAVLRLVDCSLLADHPAAGPNRYVLLDTMRSYGIERLDTDGTLAQTRDRHARWALELAERAATGLAGPHEGEWARAVRERLDEFRAAHAWLVGHDPEAGLRLAAALHPYALWRAQSEVLRWAEVAAAAAAGSGSSMLSAVLASAATGAWQRGDVNGAGATARAALEAARELDPRGRRPALEAMADVAILLGDLEEATTLFREAYELALSAGDLLQAVWDIGSASLALSWRGDREAADDLAAETVTVAERSGSPTARAFAHYVVGELAAGKDSSAEDHLSRALELAEPVGSTFVVGLARVALATLKARQHDVVAALRHYESVILEWQRAGAWTSQWVTLRTLVDLLIRVGAVRDAGVLYGAVESARTGARPFGADEAMLRDAAAELRAQLGEDTFRRFAGEGATLTENEVVGVGLDAVRRAAALVQSTGAARRVGPDRRHRR
jgi:tetratricopeptide (TPR) repeat protein